MQDDFAQLALFFQIHISLLIHAFGEKSDTLIFGNHSLDWSYITRIVEWNARYTDHLDID